MSIATEISRLQTAKADLKTAIEAKGVTVPSSATIDTYDDYVSQISGGGGSQTPSNFESWEYNDWGHPTSISVKTGVTSIPQKFQYGNSSLTACTLPNTIETISDYAFTECDSITSLTIPSGVTYIGDYSFQLCRNLSSINVPSGVTYIGTYAFASCGNSNNEGCNVSNVDLTNVSASTYFKYVFSNAKLRGTLTIPNSVLSGASSGTTSTCQNLFYGTYVNNAGLTLKVYANGVVIPRNMCGFSYLSQNSDALNLTIYGTPTFLSRASITCSSGGSVTFADCTTPPNAESYATASSSPFYNFKGTLYVPSAGLSAWKAKYTGISSQIKAIGT